MIFNPWQELGILRGADKKAIRKAFRTKVKALHPDSGGHSANAADAITRLIQAYEYLMERDEDFVSEAPPPPAGFNYREFLLARDDLLSKAKLVYYDLLRDRDDDALRLFRETNLLHRGFLTASMEREDYLDAEFLLANAFWKASALWEALDHFILLAQEETRKPYFKLFFIEIETALRKILTIDALAKWDAADVLFQIDRCLPLFIDKAELCHLYRAKATILYEAGQVSDALSSLSLALELRPKDKNLLESLKLWKSTRRP